MSNFIIVLYFIRKQVTLRDTHHNVREIMATQWSPIDSSLVIVDNYNIYYIPTVAKPNHAKQITFHGSKDLYYGITDWIYEGKYIGIVLSINIISVFQFYTFHYENYFNNLF